MKIVHAQLRMVLVIYNSKHQRVVLEELGGQSPGDKVTQANLSDRKYYTEEVYSTFNCNYS